jgi:hypothetical protein
VSADGPDQAAGSPPVSGPAPVPLRCPRCGAYVPPEQDWCLECGAPARTRLAPTPSWRAPLAVLATVVLLAGLALALAFSDLTGKDGHVTAATTAAPSQPAETVTDAVPTVPAAGAASSSTASPSTANPSTTSPSTASPAGSTAVPAG